MKVLSPGSMLVIDAMEDGESRSIGSTNILSWKKLGMVGLVTSGGLADTDEIIYHKVPTWFRRFARGIRPGRNELESVNRPVTIGGVLVRPGDVVVADGDGVVVVPRERAEDVAKAALPFLDNVTRERYIKETGQQSVGEEARRAASMSVAPWRIPDSDHIPSTSTHASSVLRRSIPRRCTRRPDRKAWSIRRSGRPGPERGSAAEQPRWSVRPPTISCCTSPSHMRRRER